MKRCSTPLVFKKWKLKPQGTTLDSKMKNTDSTQCWPVCEGTEFWHATWWECKSIQSLCRTAQFLTMLNINLPCFIESSPRYLAKRNENISVSKNPCTRIFIATLFITAQTWKKSKCSLATEMTNRLLFIHTMEYVSAMERNKPLMNCEDIW